MRYWPWWIVVFVCLAVLCCIASCVVTRLTSAVRQALPDHAPCLMSLDHARRHAFSWDRHREGLIAGAGYGVSVIIPFYARQELI